MQTVSRYIYNLTDLDHNLIMQAPTNVIAEYIGVTENSVRSHAIFGTPLLEKYYAERTDEKTKSVQKGYKKQTVDRPLSEYELLELVLVKRRQEFCNVNKNPAEHVAKLNELYGLECEVHEVREQEGRRGGRGMKSKKSFTVKVVSRG